MSKSVNKLTRKKYFQIKEVERLYKTIHKYNLRLIAYKKLLQLYIQFKKNQCDNS